MLLDNDIMVLVLLFLALVAYLVVRFFIRKVFSGRKQQILNRYANLRKKSLQIQESIGKHILARNAEKEPITEDLTYADFYRDLKSNHVSNLSGKFLTRLKNSNNPILLDKAEKNLEFQETKLKKAEMLLSCAVADE